MSRLVQGEKITSKVRKSPCPRWKNHREKSPCPMSRLGQGGKITSKVRKSPCPRWKSHREKVTLSNVPTCPRWKNHRCPSTLISERVKKSPVTSHRSVVKELWRWKNHSLWDANFARWMTRWLFHPLTSRSANQCRISLVENHIAEITEHDTPKAKAKKSWQTFELVPAWREEPSTIQN